MNPELDVVTPYGLLREWSEFLEQKSQSRGPATPAAIAGRLLAENDGYLGAALKHAQHMLSRCHRSSTLEIQNFRQVCDLMEQAARSVVTREYLADLYERYITGRVPEDIDYDPELLAAEAIENAGWIYSAADWLIENSTGVAGETLEAAKGILIKLSHRACVNN
ncbi:MAG TPA: hypothetical protein VLF41_02775 [Candidatus Nanoarchaeia archaeon]|nr:hypothetical protein [Candidatus Nanoarchaeia archaeon]